MNLLNNPKRALMLIMGVLVLIAFGIAQFYYNYKDKGIDPRIVEARKMYVRYDTYAESNNFKGIFNLLDSIEYQYASIPHYAKSYEIGVLYNNRAAAYLSMALYFENNSLSIDGVNILSKDSLLCLSEEAVIQSILLYEHWYEVYKNIKDDSLTNFIRTNFLLGLDKYPKKLQERFIKTRCKEIKEAQLENKRRLSVAYTNLGIIKRHKEDYEGAVTEYKKAMELWDRNLAAENNLNTLLGLPLKKRNFLEKILPPDKKK